MKSQIKHFVPSENLITLLLLLLADIGMFWSSKKPSREEEKEKHIKGLQHAFPSIRRPNNDDDLFEVRFVVEGQYSSLRILVTGEFPAVAPGILHHPLNLPKNSFTFVQSVIQAHGPVNHPWLNAQKVVIGSPKVIISFEVDIISHISHIF